MYRGGKWREGDVKPNAIVVAPLGKKNNVNNVLVDTNKKINKIKGV